MDALAPGPARSAAGWLDDTPVGLLAALGLGLAACAWLTATGWLPRPALGVAATVAGHGALLATALAWAAPGPRSRRRRAAPAVAVLLVGAGAVASALSPLGAVAGLATPLGLAGLARGGRLQRLGLGARPPAAGVAAGALLGALLGAHLLLTASLTLGYRVRVEAGELLAWIAYDIGANVPSAECFFRGALFERLQRRWPFGAAAAVATGASVARYLVDPLLPKTLEVAVGAALYLSLLGVAHCWLLRRTGSLVPGGAGALVFFTAYRLLAAGER